MTWPDMPENPLVVISICQVSMIIQNLYIFYNRSFNIIYIQPSGYPLLFWPLPSLLQYWSMFKTHVTHHYYMSMLLRTISKLRAIRPMWKGSSNQTPWRCMAAPAVRVRLQVPLTPPHPRLDPIIMSAIHHRVPAPVPALYMANWHHPCSAL